MHKIIGHLKLYNSRTTKQTASADEDHVKRLKAPEQGWMEIKGGFRQQAVAVHSFLLLHSEYMMVQLFQLGATTQCVTSPWQETTETTERETIQELILLVYLPWIPTSSPAKNRQINNEKMYIAVWQDYTTWIAAACGVQKNQKYRKTTLPGGSHHHWRERAPIHPSSLSIFSFSFLHSDTSGFVYSLNKHNIMLITLMWYMRKWEMPGSVG